MHILLIYNDPFIYTLCMEDKIKIYIPESILNKLVEDAKAFGFIKKNGEVNRNDFLNTLIVNYHDRYNKENVLVFEQMKKLADKYDLDSDEYDLLSITNELLSYLSSRNEEDDDEAYKTFSLKPTRNSIDTIEFIDTYSSRNMSLSGYLRNMFISYCDKPRDKRERIIFTDTYENIMKAVNENRQVHIVSTTRKTFVCMPYDIACGKEELFNYVLSKQNGKVFSLRLSKVKKAVVLNEKSSFTDNDVAKFESMRKYGPQFAYENIDEVCVELTDMGIKMFNTFYVHRPIPEKTEGNKYYFKCSHNQIFNYFARFGKEAFILYPESARSNMHRFFAISEKNYRKRINAEKTTD